MKSIESLIDAANPIVDPQSEFDENELRALLALTMERNADMDMKEVTKPVEQEPRSNRWWMAAVAFAAVVIVVGAAVLLMPDTSDGPPATTDVSPTTVPEASETSTTLTAEQEPGAPVLTDAMLAFIDSYPNAFNTGDPAVFRDVFAVGATRALRDSPELLISVDQIIEEMTHLVARQSTLTLENCTPLPTAVTCDTVISGPVENALFDGPIVARDTYIVDTEGKVSSVSASAPQVDFNAQANFERWMEAEHPDVYAEMLDLSFRQFLAYEDSEIYLEWAPIWAELGRPTP